jgi:hypothetical protein
VAHLAGLGRSRILGRWPTYGRSHRKSVRARISRKRELPQPLRVRLVRELIQHLWADTKDQAQAEEYYLGQMRALPSLQLDIALDAVRNGSASDLKWGTIERGIFADQRIVTPGFAALVSLEIAAACRSENEEEDDIETCVSECLSLWNLSRARP